MSGNHCSCLVVLLQVQEVEDSILNGELGTLQGNSSCSPILQRKIPQLYKMDDVANLLILHLLLPKAGGIGDSRWRLQKFRQSSLPLAF